MTRLEDLREDASVRGTLPNETVTVVDVNWYRSAVVEVTYKTPSG